jgi:polar amino acid transport system permease protein
MTITETARPTVQPGLTRRQVYERRQRRHSLVVAGISTAIVVIAIVVLVPKAPGWPRVHQSFFNGEVFRATFPTLLRRFWYDIQIWLISAVCILIAGMLVAMARNVRSPVLYPLKLFATLYTDLMRGIPVILLIYLVGFGVPGLGLDRPWNNPVIWGSVALILTYSAYVSEVFRAGIESVHESQRAAARSIGLSNSQTMVHVVMPQAVRRVIPPLMNDMVSLQKDVALLSVLGPVEVLRQAQVDKSKYANFTPYVGAAILFLLVTIPLTRFTDHLLQRQRGRTTGTAIR